MSDDRKQLWSKINNNNNINNRSHEIKASNKKQHKQNKNKNNNKQHCLKGLKATTTQHLNATFLR